MAAQVIVPVERLLDHAQLRGLVESVPTDGVSAYFLWTPKVTEERLLNDRALFAALLRLIGELAGRGIAVGHQYANYTIEALHDVGLAAVVHHLGWVDKGEPAEERGPAMRSCRTYVPGVRHCVRFSEASDLGRRLDAHEFAARYCECAFCTGFFEADGHPLDLLLEAETFLLKNGQERQTPTSRSVGANTWHYLLSRRLEVQAFSDRPATDVIASDIERASSLMGVADAARLSRLATELKSA